MSVSSALRSMTAAEAVDRLLAAVETPEEGEILKDLLVRADLGKDCSECEELHRSAGLLCAGCRRPFMVNMPTEAQWFIHCGEPGMEEDGTWYLRNGVGSETLVFAVNSVVGAAGEPEAMLWAKDVLEADWGISVQGWSPQWEGEPKTLTPECWVAEV